MPSAASAVHLALLPKFGAVLLIICLVPGGPHVVTSPHVLCVVDVVDQVTSVEQLMEEEEDTDEAATSTPATT